MKGTFTFEKVPMNGSAVGPAEDVEVQIPLTLVDYNAKVRQAHFPYWPDARLADFPFRRLDPF